MWGICAKIWYRLETTGVRATVLTGLLVSVPSADTDTSLTLVDVVVAEAHSVQERFQLSP